MFEWLGITPQALLAQLLVGLINGSFYAVLSLGLAIIFGLLNIINFTHGSQYMLGAFVAWLGLTRLGPWLGHDDWTVNYWAALALSPLVVGAFGMLIERAMLKRLYHLDHLYGLLLTFGLALVIEGMFRQWFGISGESYDVPEALSGAIRLEDLGIILPKYRIWVVVASLVVCFSTWWVIERTRLGAYLRAGTENPQLLQAFGVNVPLMVTLTYGYGVALAAFAGVLAAPVFQVNPIMGSNLIIVVFAVVVIGGMGSILGAILTGLGLGLIEGLTKVFYAQGSAVVIFVIMAVVLLLRPAGLFGREK
jgi:branched-chain amino acid transport system permease protein